MLAVGDRVLELGRSKQGVVVALRPQGMVDVQYPGEPLQRRPSGKLVRSNRGRLRANRGLSEGDFVEHVEDRRVGMIERIFPGGEACVVRWSQGGKTVCHLHRLRRFAANPRKSGWERKTRDADPGSAYLEIVAHAIWQDLVQKGVDPKAARSQAFRIAAGRAQQYGYIYPGTKVLTPKGQAQLRAKLAEPDAAIRAEAIEHWLAQGRKAKGYRVVRSGDGFVVQPGGKRFKNEQAAWDYAESLGEVSPEVGREVAEQAAEARAARKALEKESKKAARTARQKAGAYKGHRIVLRNGRHEIDGTDKWFGSLENARAWIDKQRRRG